MDTLLQPYVQALARALGHFIWQGAMLGLAAHLVVRRGRLDANARYTVGVLCLIAMAAMPIGTTVYLSRMMPRARRPPSRAPRSALAERRPSPSRSSMRCRPDPLGAGTCTPWSC